MSGYWDTDKDDKEALVEVSWRAGHSAREIAQALQERFGGKVTRNMVVSKAHRLALPLHTSATSWRGQQFDKRRKG